MKITTPMHKNTLMINKLKSKSTPVMFSNQYSIKKPSIAFSIKARKSANIGIKAIIWIVSAINV